MLARYEKLQSVFIQVKMERLEESGNKERNRYDYLPFACGRFFYCVVSSCLKGMQLQNHSVFLRNLLKRGWVVEFSTF